jgi:ring-1,2-phenylacetyl-CoA epoxidase subunit PaaD
MAERLTVELAWQLLEEVKDPEIPVVSLVEMGILREVEVSPQGDFARVTLAPTFSGCPALHVMRQEVEDRLKQAGASSVEVVVSHNPPWSSDWIRPAAREKLRCFGLAPPPVHGGNFELPLLDVARCPHCGSEDTVLKNSFGPTLCRMIYACRACGQPFEQFKPL